MVFKGGSPRRRIFVRSGCLFLIALSFPALATACSCAGPSSPGKAYKESAAVFSGVVLEERAISSESLEKNGPHFSFRIIKSWKGVTGKTVELAAGGPCHYFGFKKGEAFLVYAHQSAPLSTSMCSRTKPLKDVAVEMLILDTVAAGKDEETVMRRLPEILSSDPRDGARSEAALMLARHASKEVAFAAIPKLISALKDRSAGVRTAVVQALDQGPWIYVDDNQRSIGHALIPVLNDTDPNVRRETAKALIKHSALPETIPALRRALKAEQQQKAPDDKVIRAIATTLAERGDTEAKREAASALLSDLSHTNEGIRMNAAQALGKAGRVAGFAVPKLVSCLKDPNQFVRYSAAGSLGQIADREALPSLKEALADSDLSVRAQAASSIYLLGSKQDLHAAALPALISSLTTNRDHSRHHIVRVLGEIGPEASAAVPALVLALQEGQSHERYSICETLGKIGPRAGTAAPAILSELKSAEAWTKPTLIRALQGINVRSPAVTGALMEALRDSDLQVRFAAAAVLRDWDVPQGRELARKEVLPMLLEEMSSSAAEKRQQAIWQLSSWGPDAVTAVPALIRTLRDDDEWVRKFSATALGKIGPAAKDAVPELTAMVKKKSERVEAIVALGGIRSPDAVPTLLPLLSDADLPARVNAAASLRNIGTPEALKAFDLFASKEIPDLVLWLKDVTRQDRGEAARYLVELAPATKQALGPLTEALRDEDWLTRTKSAEALGALGPAAGSSVPVLAAALEDRHEYVRNAASEALTKIASPEAVSALEKFNRPPAT